MPRRKTDFRHLNEKDLLGTWDGPGVGHSIRSAGLLEDEAIEWLTKVDKLRILLRVVSGVAEVKYDPDDIWVNPHRYFFDLGPLLRMSYAFEDAGWSAPLMREFLTEGIQDPKYLALIQGKAKLIYNTVTVDSDVLPKLGRNEFRVDNVSRGHVEIIPSLFKFVSFTKKKEYMQYGMHHDEDMRDGLLTDEEKRLNQEAVDRFNRWRTNRLKYQVNATVAPHVIDHLLDNPLWLSELTKEGCAFVFCGTRIRAGHDPEPRFITWEIKRNGDEIKETECLFWPRDLLPSCLSLKNPERDTRTKAFVVCYRTPPP